MIESAEPSGVFDSIGAAVAELDRRDAARDAEKPAKAAPVAEGEDEDLPAASVEDDEAEEGEEGEATEEKDEPEEPAKTSIEFDGKTLEIPEGTPPELVEAVQKLGSDLKADYTRKTQAVAEEKRLVESAKEQTTAQISQLQAAQVALAKMAQGLIGTEPSLELAQQDPQSYLVQKGLYEKRIAEFNAFVGEYNQSNQSLKQQQAEQLAQIQRAESEALLKAVPELATPGKFQKFRETVIDAGSKYGFKPEEIAGLVDHRMVLALRDLAKFHKQQASVGDLKTKLQNVPPKVAKPGSTSQTDPKVQSAQEAKREFLKSGRTDRDLRRWAARTS